MNAAVTKLRKTAAAPGPALPGFVPTPQPQGEPVLARLADGREIAGALAGFSAAEQRIDLAGAGLPAASFRFAELQWMKFTQPVDPVRSAEAYRSRGINVETLPQRSPFSISFANGQVLTAELYGYGAAQGGLGLYVAEDGGRALRMFVPSSAIDSFTVGERLGQLLLTHGQITEQGLEVALERQRALRKQRLGELLLQQCLVTRSELEQALATQAGAPVRPLGEVLTEMGVLTAAQLDAALAAQRGNRRKPLGEVLLELHMIDRATLDAVLAQKLGIPQIDLKRYDFDPQWAALAPYPLCRDHGMVPLFRSQGAVAVATANPLDIERLNVVSFALGASVLPVLASAEDIAWALGRHPERRMHETLQDAGLPAAATAAAPAAGENAEALAMRLGRELGSGSEALEPNVDVTDSTLVRLVNKIIADAHEQKASDIHLEPGVGGDRLRVRFRRDGALLDYLTLPARFRAAIVSRLKIMASLDISERRRPQDGKIDFRRFGGLPLELRIACIPTHDGAESVVLRVLAGATPLPISKIGLAPRDLERLRTLAEKPHGLLVVCGPTGSGKTTTLHSVLAHLNQPQTKIWTAEDPIEITQPGLNQVQVQPGIGWTFAAALRAFLRADPDVVMVGEVRDAETARIAVEASLTGHLVLTTLHTNSAAESVVRLADLGLDPFSFSDALLGVLAQRLSRRLCARCARSEPASDAALQALAAEYCTGSALHAEEVVQAWRGQTGAEKLRLASPVGCRACSGTGYAGRVALYELLVASPAVKRLMLREGTVEQLRAQAALDGMHTLKQDGIEKVLQGLTTIEEVRAVVG